ncbi:hypothetical protein SteCoe_26471 [Stentor coeruleus]|uniref:PARP catalytic domain-containing protein n=1 Tax=Stentor coeruleus TaxID=5963 RepID=A0A1R2BCR3_9CILI|nr:hypothetical protein SteCoe_26471 [Stentor coeruleus]
MSEVDFLIRQLKYCLNQGYSEASKKIVEQLILLKGKVSISHELKYICSSHENLFFKKYASSSIQYFIYFESCQHLVCGLCLNKYIRGVFDRMGIAYIYTCPGCNAVYSLNKTILDQAAEYFQRIVSLEEQQKAYDSYNLTLAEVRGSMLKKSTPCFFFENPGRQRCRGQSKVERIPSCKHNVCHNCLKRDLEVQIEVNSEYVCPVPDCCRPLAHSLIKEILTIGEDLTKKIWPHLSIDDIYLVTCPLEICNHQAQVPQNEFYYKCICGIELCPRCNLQYHPDYSCAVAKEGGKDYKKILCLEDDPILDYRSHFSHAVSLFEWDMHQGTKKKLQEKMGAKFKVTKVMFIYNPTLQERYNKGKKKIIDAGIDPGEIFVYHATSNDVYEKICTGGFLVGNVDVKQSIGKLCGLGVYTATDATMSINFYGNKKILLCKGLKGKQSDHPISDKHEFLTTDCNSYYKDFSGTQSDYWIFFQKENVLPFYYIEYE